MKVDRWYYVKEPSSPQVGAGGPVPPPGDVRRDTGLREGEPGADQERDSRATEEEDGVGRLPPVAVRKYTGALRTDVVGYVWAPGLEEFERVPADGAYDSKANFRFLAS